MNFRKQNPRPSEQIMAPLPSARVPPADPPFTHVGVDHFGPLFAKQGHSQVKCYGCLFTCLTMREVHIEVLHTLEADSFIYAYQCQWQREGAKRCTATMAPTSRVQIHFGKDGGRVIYPHLKQGRPSCC